MRSAQSGLTQVSRSSGRPRRQRRRFAWNDGTVARLAGAIYEERTLPTGTLDRDGFAVLADALEEAGCAKEDILRHCREEDTVHVRGCWVIDLLLRKASPG